MLANHIAPGISRDFAAQKWGLFDDRIWKEERERANSLVKKDTDFVAFGSDLSRDCVELTAQNAKHAGVSSFLRLETKDIKDFVPSSETGTLVTNPPYGERMLDLSAAEKIYRIMGGKFDAAAAGVTGSSRRMKNSKNISAEGRINAANCITV